MKKKLSIVLALCMILSTGVISALAYSDVSNDNWAVNVINRWGGLLEPDTTGTFKPNAVITRGEFMYLLNSIMKFPAGTSSFTDIASSPYKADIDALYTAGIVTGANAAGTLFNPNGAFTREQSVLLFARAIGVSPSTEALSYTDAAKIQSWAAPYVRSMQAGGYVSSENTTFNPQREFTRAEAMQLIQNLAANYVNNTTAVKTVSSGNMVINAAGAVVQDITVNGDLIIAPGVGNGDVTLSNVNVLGTVYVRGGGVNTIKINGNSNIGRIVVEKTSAGGVRVLTEGNTVVTAVVINNGKDAVVIEGTVGTVMVSGNAPVTINAAVESLVVQNAGSQVEVNSAVTNILVQSADVSLNISAAANVGSVYAANTATGVDMQISGTVASVDTAAPASNIALSATAKVTDLGVSGSAVGSSVDNKGTVANATIKAADATVANTGTIEKAATPESVTVTGTAPVTETVVEAGKVTDVYSK